VVISMLPPSSRSIVFDLVILFERVRQHYSAGRRRTRPHCRCWSARPDLGLRRSPRLVATAAEDRLNAFRATFTSRLW
jgi:hypothetical protein